MGKSERTQHGDVPMWIAFNDHVYYRTTTTKPGVADPVVVPAEQLRGAVYVIGRLDDALRAVDPEYAGSPLEGDEVRPFLDSPGGQ